jgi:phenylpropionate dioxygenase-like ring-hydroxylating dioxygenase large terminal subunit
VSTIADQATYSSTLWFDQYSDPARAAAESELVRSSWQYFGPAEKVSRPGTYLTGHCGNVPVVVVRDLDGVLRAHVNVCRHRGTVVMRGEGECRRLQCPYHAWTFSLDGALKNAPRSDREESFDASSLSLVPARVIAFGPLLFVAADARAPSIDEGLAELGRTFDEIGLGVDDLVYHGRTPFETAANWKIVMENYLECYHCPVAHPGFAAVMETSPDKYVLSAVGDLLSHRTSVRGRAPETFRSGPLPVGTYQVLMPNHTFDVNPGQPNLAASVTVPVGPGHSKGFTDRYFGPGVTKEFIDEMIAFDDEVGAQDQDLVEWVQEGVSSGAVPAGHLLLDSEQLVAAFQARVHQRLDERTSAR